MKKTYYEFIKYINECIHNSEIDDQRFDRFINCNGDYEEGGVVIEYSKISSIKKFYDATNSYNKSKISDLINISVGGIDKVYNIVLEWTKNKVK